MRWKCTCAYDGTDYCGWQSQPNRNTIQDAIESQLLRVFKRPIRIYGGGRTDAGVHAHGQVFHFDADWNYGADKLRLAINVCLEHAIRILKVELANPDFHARYSACWKCYHYHFQFHPLNPFSVRYRWQIPQISIDRMQAIAQLLVGTHDFRGFGNKIMPEENTIKTIRSADIIQQDEHFIFSVIGSGYLYHMVRIMMGVLATSSLHDPSMIKQLLKGQSSSIPIVPAPPQGLFLEWIDYNTNQEEIC